MLNEMILVGVGAFLGAISRFVISQWFQRYPISLPYGTLVVNLFGSFLIGVFIGLSISSDWMLLWGTGFLGAFTTFSTVHWEALQFQKHSKWRKMILYLSITYTLALLLVMTGYLIGAYLPSP